MKNVVFGGSLVQLILAALSLYLSEEGPRKGLFSDAPFGQFCLAAYLPKGMPLAMHHLLVLARGAESYIAKRRDSGRAERYIAKHCGRQRYRKVHN